MFDFKRDSGDRQQEAIDAYLDNALTPAERARFEAQMAADARLRAEVEQLRALRLQLRAMPRRRVPRSFALNPAAYSRPKAQPLLQLYPALRGATALSAFLLIFVLALGLFNGQFGVGAPAASQVAEVAQEDAAQAVVEEAAVEEAAPMAAEDEAARATASEAPAAESELAEAAATGAPAADLLLQAPAGTITATVPADLSLESAELAEATLPANAGGAIEQYAAEPTAEATAMAAPTSDVLAQTEAAAEEAPAPAEPARSLLPLQIGLGALFLLLLGLWLVARRRVRSL
jgi:hypothetical protein